MQLYQREHNGSNVYYENNDIAGDSFGVSEAMASGVSGIQFSSNIKVAIPFKDTSKWMKS